MTTAITIILLISLIWYLIGSVGGLWVSKKIYPKLTSYDYLLCFTIGGIGGLLTILIGSTYVRKW